MYNLLRHSATFSTYCYYSELSKFCVLFKIVVIYTPVELASLHVDELSAATMDEDTTIMELNAAHAQELADLRENHKQESASWLKRLDTVRVDAERKLVCHVVCDYFTSFESYLCCLYLWFYFIS